MYEQYKLRFVYRLSGNSMNGDCQRDQLKAKKTEKNNEGFDKLHMIPLIHVYALAQISQV